MEQDYPLNEYSTVGSIFSDFWELKSAIIIHFLRYLNTSILIIFLPKSRYLPKGHLISKVVDKRDVYSAQ